MTCFLNHFGKLLVLWAAGKKYVWFADQQKRLLFLEQPVQRYSQSVVIVRLAGISMAMKFSRRLNLRNLYGT
jgi:hypothetical protein